MTPEQHHNIMMKSMDKHIDAMPEGAHAIMLSLEVGSMNASVVSTMDDVDTARLLRETLKAHEARN